MLPPPTAVAAMPAPQATPLLDDAYRVEAHPADQAGAVAKLLHRVLPEYQHLFDLAIIQTDPAAFFTVEVLDGRIFVCGTSGIELASGIHWFLKYYANSSMSWQATGGRQLDAGSFSSVRLRELELRGRMRVERAVPHSYYQNIVTVSYSFAYWDWERWEQEIDWMALQGINLPLAPAGIEYVWLQTYQQLGLCAQDLHDFFPGPSFLAWGRMGNIQGYAGPLPLEYMQQQAALQQRIVSRMRELGMTPVFPAFAGFVPAALVRKFPQAQVTRCSPWAHFPDPHCCPFLLLPSDPLFAQLGSAYVRNLRRLFGWDRKGYYTADLFNEQRPASAEGAYLRGCSASVYGAMAAADPSAVWLMQAWMVFSDAAFWQEPQLRALLSGVPRERLILLDLFADEHPLWQRTCSFYGTPFIWCMLHNFGGNMETYGALPSVQEGVSRALAASSGPSTMVGVGMAPEGIEQNPVVYEYMAEQAFKGRHQVPLAQWVQQYAARRYGGAAAAGGEAASSSLHQAWQQLLRCSYSCSDRLHNTVCDVPTSRPGLSAAEVVGWGLRPHHWCRLADVAAAWRRLLEAGWAAEAAAAAAGSGSQGQRACGSRSALALSPAYQYDLVDVGREVLSKLATSFWQGVVDAYQAGGLQQLQDVSAGLCSLLQQLDALLASHAAFLLGPRLAQARSCAEASAAARGAGTTGNSASSSSSRAACSALARLYEVNLRRQLTIWGTSASAGDSEVSDYANREWSGLISSFYLPRWQLWLQRLQQDLRLQRTYDPEAWRQQCLAFTFGWIQDTACTAALPLQPAGDPLHLSQQLFEAYGRPLLQQAAAAEAARCAAEAAAAVLPGALCGSAGPPEVVAAD